jgi:hypothetical protein
MIENTKAFIEVETSAQATTLQKLSGIRFFKSKLFINYANRNVESQNVAPLKPTLLPQLLSFVETHYNRDTKFLKYSSFYDHHFIVWELLEKPKWMEFTLISTIPGSLELYSLLLDRNVQRFL